MLIILIFCQFFTVIFGLGCKDQTNKPVDWYVVYKLPKRSSNDNTNIHEGLAFMYITPDNQDQWTFSDININDTSNLIANTLGDLYGDSTEEDLYILYNDQPPYGTMSSKGHTKGVVMANEKEGFWLIHSVPHFPPLNRYSYPETGTHFGQSFLCISLNASNVDRVGIQLQYNEPHIYAENVPERLETLLPHLTKAASNNTVQQSPWYQVRNLTSQAGVLFTSYAKSGKFGKDLYADLVSPSLMSDLYVETWPNEPNRLPSNCQHKFQVDNVLSIAVSNPEMTFKTTLDHSKWAVSAHNDSVKWICIGDINRAEKQTLRGGGTTCVNNQKLASRYVELVSSVQKCQSTTIL